MSQMPDAAELMACCREAAHAAGKHAHANAHRRREIAQRTSHDVKLRLDLECQEMAEHVIRSAFPDHRILGEEGGTFAGEGPLWIIDPIDGTVNFTHGLPLWCSSVAVRAGGAIAAGAVFIPALAEFFEATYDGPALRNGEVIRVSDVERVEASLVCTGLSKHVGKDPFTVATFEAISIRAQKTRLMGAAAVDICGVACGRVDGYFESSIHLWDVAAAGLVVTRAGGRAEVLEQLDPVRMRYLCSNGRIHDELKGIVQPVLDRCRP